MAQQTEDFRLLEAEQRIYLSDQDPLVIRLDGKDVTKDKVHYDLTEPEGFTKAILLAAKAAALVFVPPMAAEMRHGIGIVRNRGVLLFAMMDEVSIIFRTPCFFFRNFDDTNQIYDTGIFLQEFLSALHRDGRFPDTRFGISGFNIPAQKCRDYICWRRGLCKEAAVMYAAKRSSLPKEIYAGKSSGEILKALSAEQILLPSHPEYLSGWQEELLPAKGSSSDGSLSFEFLF
ncbi:MAG: hypothetical protein LUC94_01200 [Clostridiales bacterium]|nr:hypothetical protein [Clostridiales bacterium]